MKIKSKLLLSFGFLLIMILILGAAGSFYVLRLGEEAESILKNNSLSLQYMHSINKEVDLIEQEMLFEEAPDLFENNLSTLNQLLRLQKENVTEPDEREFTVQLASSIESLERALKTNSAQDAFSNIYGIKEAANNIYEINQERIFVRNEEVISKADNMIKIMLLLSLFAGMIVMGFTFKMPSYLTRPFHKFNHAIDQISRGVYDIDLYLGRKDEFGDLASSFRLMTVRLKEFEQSNYSKILFEKKRLDAIVNQLSEAVVGLDEGKRILFANKKALELLKLNKKEMEGRYAPDVAVNNKLMQNLIKEIMTGRGNYEDFSPITIAVENKEKLFSKSIVDIITSPTGENKEVIAGQVIILTDVTEFADKDKAKTFFMATLGHQLKTPIAAIDLGTELLRNIQTGALNEEQKEWVETIAQNNDRIRRTVNELLDLSQIESGTIDIINTKTLTREMIETAVKGVRLFLNEKHLKINLPLNTRKNHVLADPQKAIWVLNNFLTNAIRYSPSPGTINITEEEKDLFIKISVIDKGKGIDLEQKKAIFTPYFRNKENNTEGTGLGLAISKEFIEAMGGEIGVESDEGNGACFWINLKKSPA